MKQGQTFEVVGVVLILVLVEHTLGVRLRMPLRKWMIVLILVLVEHTLGGFQEVHTG